jgi:hypothetical protein
LQNRSNRIRGKYPSRLLPFVAENAVLPSLNSL